MNPKIFLNESNCNVYGWIRACRGIGASLPEDKIRAFEHAHIEMLHQAAPPSFEIPQHATMRILRNCS